MLWDFIVVNKLEKQFIAIDFCEVLRVVDLTLSVC